MQIMLFADCEMPQCQILLLMEKPSFVDQMPPAIYCFSTGALQSMSMCYTGLTLPAHRHPPHEGLPIKLSNVRRMQEVRQTDGKAFISLESI